MRIRVAMVVWWIGTIVLVGALLGGVSKGLQGAPGALAHIAGFVPLGLVLWAVAFVLGGSFWKPPKPK